MTDGDAKRAAAQASSRSAAAAERQAQTAERRERRESTHVPFKDIATGVGSIVKGLKNHPQWYLNYPGSEYFGKLSFEMPSGRPSQHGTALNGSFLTIKYLPSLGQGKNDGNENIAIYRALLAMQQEVRLVNSGAKNYEPVDIAIYAIATGEVLAMYGELARIYSLINSDDPKNVWKKELALRCLTGLKYQDVAKNGPYLLATLRAAYSTMRTVAIPHIPYYDRIWHLAFNMFNDCKAARTNVIGFVREGFGMLVNSGYVQEQTSARVWMRQQLLAGQDASGRKYGLIEGDITSRCDALMEMVNAITNSTDFITIMGDLAKAYGQTFNLPQIEDDIKPSFLDDDVTLTQIDNTILVGTPVWLTPQDGQGFFSLYDVTEQDGQLVQGAMCVGRIMPPSFKAQQSVNDMIVADFAPIDAPVDVPSPEDVFVLTRNITTYEPSEEGLKFKNYQLLTLPDATEPTLKGCSFTYGSFDESNVCIAAVYDENWINSFDAVNLDSTLVNSNDEAVAPRFIVPRFSGSEIFTQMIITQTTALRGRESFNAAKFACSHWSCYEDSGTSLLALRWYAPFHHAPTLIAYDDDERPVYAANVAPTYNCIEVEEDFIKHIHYAALFSEFTIAKGGNASQQPHRDRGKRK